MTGDLFGIDPSETALAAVGLGSLSQAGLFEAVTGGNVAGLVGYGLEPGLGPGAVPLGAYAGSAIGGNPNLAERYGYGGNYGYAGYGYGADYDYGHRCQGAMFT